MLGCCGVVVAQWSECRQLRLEALGSIPSGYPCIFLQYMYVSILIYHQLLTTSYYHQLLLISIVKHVDNEQVTGECVLGERVCE